MQYLLSRQHPHSEGYVFVQADQTIDGQPLIGTQGRENVAFTTPSKSSQAGGSPEQGVPALEWSSPSQVKSPRGQEGQEPTLSDQWLRRTGWQAMFRGRSRRWIRQSRQIPTRSAGLFPFEEDFQRPVHTPNLAEWTRPALCSYSVGFPHWGRILVFVSSRRLMLRNNMYGLGAACSSSSSVFFV